MTSIYRAKSKKELERVCLFLEQAEISYTAIPSELTITADESPKNDALKRILEICQDNVNHYDDAVYSDVHNEFKFLVDEVEKIIW